MAFASITSLMSTISLSLSHQSVGDVKEQTEYLCRQLDSLRTLVEDTHNIIRDRKVLKTLEAQTTETIEAAEDMVDSEFSKQTMGIAETFMVRISRKLDPSLMKKADNESLKKVIGDVDGISEEWMKMKNMYSKKKDLKPQPFDLCDSPQHVLKSNNIMVGYDDEFEMMLDKLVRDCKEDLVISLLGMGGIGKTTFATRIFNEPLVMSHFDVCAKITVSQEYHVRNLYLGLLHYTSSRSEGLDAKDDGELAGLLQKSLKGRRYLVIVDDIWTTEAWDDIQMCFPFQNNGSRILLTTRNKEVADYATSGTSPYKMRLLTFDECWNLLYQKVFKNECLTLEFEEIGKEIVKKCQGLPLAIVVMSGILLKIGKSIDEWKKVVEDLNLAVSTDLDRYCSGVLALSYYHLPHHLRACLLYMVVFKKRSEIRVNKLFKLWAAEGFVKVKRGEVFETVAMRCLKDLIDRNLVSVDSWSFYGKIKSCRIHDMIHGFFLGEAQNTNFLNIVSEKQVQRQGSQSTILFPSNQHRISIQCNGRDYQITSSGDTGTNVRSILSCGNRLYTVKLDFSCFKLLRILDMITVEFEYTLKGIEDLFYLRYLACTVTKYTSVIANLKNLQTLTCRSHNSFLHLPKEIWRISQLRHLKSSLIYLADPPPENEAQALEHLHTLSGLNPACCSPSVLKGISNVKRLQLQGTRKNYTATRSGSFQHCDFSPLHRLESLTVVVEVSSYRDFTVASWCLPPATAFPQNLKKLTLQETRLPWKEMTTIGKLPRLEVLKLKEYACLGRWKMIEQEFTQLKFLLLDGKGLDSWEVSSDSFPRLEHLVLENVELAIPQVLEDVMTLQRIELNMCAHNAVVSAKHIQQQVGDNILDVRVRNPRNADERLLFHKPCPSSTNRATNSRYLNRPLDVVDGATSPIPHNNSHWDSDEEGYVEITLDIDDDSVSIRNVLDVTKKRIPRNRQTHF